MARSLVSLITVVVLLLSSSGVSAQQTSKIEIDRAMFDRDVCLHVLLHEMAHAIVREFDLPVLGNEETMADAFATYYLTTYLPEEAPRVLLARIESWRIEAGEVPREEWDVSGEHNSDARRAHQVASLAIAADPERYEFLGRRLGMSERDIRSSADYGSDILRSWRRILRPLMMPDRQTSSEYRVQIDPGSKVIAELKAKGLVSAVENALRKIDWHSQITLSFIEGDGGAGWNRGRRTITIYDQYVRRFQKQAQMVKSPAESPNSR